MLDRETILATVRELRQPRLDPDARTRLERCPEEILRLQVLAVYDANLEAGASADEAFSAAMTFSLGWLEGAHRSRITRETEGLVRLALELRGDGA